MLIRALVLIYILLVIAAVIQTVVYYPQLPDIVASHFDGSGSPNGWSSKETFFFIYFGVLLLSTGAFLLIPSLMRRTPESYVNMPNKDYWLAGGRKEQTLSFIQKKMYRFGIATALFLMSVIQLAISANLSSPRRLNLSVMWVLLITYFIYTGVWIITFIKRFKKVS